MCLLRGLYQRPAIPSVPRSSDILHVPPPRVLSDVPTNDEPLTIASQLVDLSISAWAKLVVVAIVGVTVGTQVAIHGSSLLAQHGIFTYVPDDDDDDDDDDDKGKAKKEDDGERGSQGLMDLTDVFGELKILIGYNWHTDDVSYITLSKSKLEETLRELEEAIKVGDPQGVARKEADLAVRFLKDSLRLCDERVAEIQRREAQKLQDSVVKRSWWSWWSTS
ncbi:hypothetical protein HK104_001856 [Borealophlyctis nickersoniae]|nr:hypothetical protein HK104_001856 [Borealophlyctis nickersoniae]